MKCSFQIAPQRLLSGDCFIMLQLKICGSLQSVFDFNQSAQLNDYAIKLLVFLCNFSSYALKLEFEHFSLTSFVC